MNFQGSPRSKGKYRAQIQERQNTFPLPAHAAARTIDKDHRGNADTLARVHSTMGAYPSIAITVFGNPKVSVDVGLLLAHTRLFQGAQGQSAVSLSSLRRLKTGSMRDSRRIAAKLRYDSSCSMSDCQVRVLLSMPATEIEKRKVSPCRGCTTCALEFSAVEATYPFQIQRAWSRIRRFLRVDESH